MKLKTYNYTNIYMLYVRTISLNLIYISPIMHFFLQHRAIKSLDQPQEFPQSAYHPSQSYDSQTLQSCS
ncbi:hypothetical protein Hanom_Chr14g01300311 [Helianthus anomalus]